MFVIVKKRRPLIATAAAAVLGIVTVLAVAIPPKAQTASLTVTDWGLSFRQEGQPPVGNATAEELRDYDAAFLGDTGKKTIYLTFDAGYENGYTPQILDTLKKQHVPAAFFVVGNYLQTAPELVQRMTDEGHLVGNHTWHHPDMSAVGDKAAFAAELTAVEEAYTAITGKNMVRLYRPPQGKFSRQNLAYAKELGYRTFFWSLAYVDWYTDNQPTREEALEKLTARIHNGAIVLLHSTSRTNAEVLDELITRWKHMGYSFGRLSRLP